MSKINAKFAYLKDKFEDVENYFNKSDATVHKARNELKCANIEGIDVVIKSFKVPHFFNRIIYTYFRKSKAYKSFHNAVKLRQVGVNTPEPIAFLEFKKPTLLEKSYFISREFKYDFTIREALLHQIDDYKEVLREFAKFTYYIHEQNIWHKDYSPGNILIKRHEDGGYEFSLVDINRMEFVKIAQYDGLENFNKLWADEDDMRIMAKEYALLANLDEKKAIEIAIKHDRANKRVKNFKKWLKVKLKNH
ncbi:MAG: lipopolysaccharide kinase InaA family protein [Campylobacterota bacterium]|nr:lipopolysaccharide kinase InaA family protein [Campylobacterota bacterium]